MITLIATAALLSCTEAQQLINRVSPEYFTRREYRDIVRVIRDSASPRCDLVDREMSTRRRRYAHNYPIYLQRPYYDHPGYRPGWRPPSIVFVGPQPSLTFRF